MVIERKKTSEFASVGNPFLTKAYLEKLPKEELHVYLYRPPVETPSLRNMIATHITGQPQLKGCIAPVIFQSKDK